MIHVECATRIRVVVSTRPLVWLDWMVLAAITFPDIDVLDRLAIRV